MLNERGHEAIHTSSLPEGNRSTDRQISTIADAQGRIVVSKDADFRNSHLLSGSPRRLLIVQAGAGRLDYRLRAAIARGMPDRREWPRGAATAKAASAGTKRVSAGSAEPLLVTTPKASDESARSAREPRQKPRTNCERFCAIMTTVYQRSAPTPSATLLRLG
jgi:Domain of unknown function (DUF5615)